MAAAAWRSVIAAVKAGTVDDALIDRVRDTARAAQAPSNISATLHAELRAAKLDGELTDKQALALFAYLQVLVAAASSERFTEWHAVLRRALESAHVGTAGRASQLLAELAVKDETLAASLFASALAATGDEFHGVVLAIGDLDPRLLFQQLAPRMVAKTTRLAAMDMLCNFASRQPRHLHTILETPCFAALVTSMLMDESLELFMVELRVLVMLLPACCHKLASLFHIYVALFLRCFRWLSYTHDHDVSIDEPEVSAPTGPADTSLLHEEEAPASAFPSGGYLLANYDLPNDAILSDWDAVRTDDVTDKSASAEALLGVFEVYFGLLYGTFPCNIIDLLRVIAADERYRSKVTAFVSPLVQRHTLSVGLFFSSKEAELSASRFASMEPQDVLALCSEHALLAFGDGGGDARGPSMSITSDGSDFVPLPPPSGLPSLLDADLIAGPSRALTDQHGGMLSPESQSPHASRPASPAGAVLAAAAASVTTPTEPSPSSPDGAPRSPVASPVSADEANAAPARATSPAAPPMSSPTSSRTTSPAAVAPGGSPAGGVARGPLTRSPSDLTLGQPAGWQDRRIQRRRSDPSSRTSAGAAGSSSAARHHAYRAATEEMMRAYVASGVAEHFGAGAAAAGAPEPYDAILAEHRTLARIASTAASGAEALARQVLLLTNQLAFERYLRNQYVQLVRRFHREKANRATQDLDRDTMYEQLRTQKQELRLLRDKVASQRADLVVIKEKHDKWEMDLRAKLNKYREENRTLHAQCAGYAVTVEQLRALVADQETKLANAEEAVSELERRLSTAEPKAERVDEFKTKNNQLVEQLLLWEEESRQHEERKKQVETLITLAIEKDHVIEAAQIKIAELTRHLEEKRTRIGLLQSRISQLETSLEGQNALTSEMRDLLAHNRQSHVAQIEALEDKYQAIKNVCVQLEFRVLDLAGQLEVARTLGTETRPKPRTLSRGASAESVAIDTTRAGAADDASSAPPSPSKEDGPFKHASGPPASSGSVASPTEASERRSTGPISTAGQRW